MIYLNNAATSFPKPQCVQDAYAAALAALPVGQFRSGVENEKDDIFESCKKNLGKLLGIADHERIYFTSGATESLNLLIHGCRLQADQFVTTAQDHNSVLRPLFNLTPGKKPHVLSCDTYGRVDPKNLEELLTKDQLTNGTDNGAKEEAGGKRTGRIKALIFSHCSNVTGAVQDVRALTKIAKKYGLLVILDVSQSAGCIDVKVDEWGIDALAFTGHKSLLGVQGTGGMYIRRGVPICPVKFGGTGRNSSTLVYPLEAVANETRWDPDTADEFEFEVGTGNGPGIAALAASTQWILEKGISEIEKKERSLMNALFEGLRKIPGITVFGNPIENRGPVLSFQIRGMKATDVSYILQNSYGIVTRCGLHCAPLIHECIGSGPDGTVRVSVSYDTSEADIEHLVNAVRDIADAVS